MSLKVDLRTNSLDGSSLSFTLSRNTNAPSQATLTIKNPTKDTFGVYKVHLDSAPRGACSRA